LLNEADVIKALVCVTFSFGLGPECLYFSTFIVFIRKSYEKLKIIANEIVMALDLIFFKIKLKRNYGSNGA